MKKETITLNPQEQKRVLVLNRIQAGQLSAAQAAELLQLSERHVRRILAAERSEGVVVNTLPSGQVWPSNVSTCPPM